MATSGFNSDLERGKVGEKLFLKYLENNGVSARDVSEDSAYWGIDVDLISADGITYEVKTDYASQWTGNLAIEYLREGGNGDWYKKGWLEYSTAEYFVFVQPDNKVGYIISAKNLRLIIKSHKLETRTNNRESYVSVWLYLLPINKFIDWFEVIEL